MNRLGIISDEVSQDLDTAIRFAKDFALDGLEIRSVAGKAFKDLTIADAKILNRSIKDAGLAIAGAATPVFKCALEDEAEIKNHIEIFKRAVEYAELWGCGVIRVFVFFRKEEPSRMEDIRRAGGHLLRLIDALGGSSVRIGIENEGTTLVCTGLEAATLLNEIPSEPSGIVWDPCNILFIPGETRPVADDFPHISGRILHLHVKDARREMGKPATHCVELGKGEIDYPAQFQMLRSAGYEGWITLETHWRSQPLSAEQSHLPAGHAFSANAEEPSRICMEHLRKMLADRNGGKP